jgi:hypothetical protein
MDNSEDGCAICYESPREKPLVWLKCCRQPICVSCKGRHEANDRLGSGCPFCRSTLGVMHVNINLSEMGMLKLRLDGNEESVMCSSRTIRRFVSHARKPWEAYMGTVRSTYSEDVFDDHLWMESVAVVAAFLQFEITRNARLRSFIGDRCETPYGADGSSRWCYSVYWSQYPFHPDDVVDDSEANIEYGIDPIYHPSEFTVEHVMTAAAAEVASGRML